MGRNIWRLRLRPMSTDTATQMRAQKALTVYSSPMVSRVNTWGRRSTRYRPVPSWRSTLYKKPSEASSSLWPDSRRLLSRGARDTAREGWAQYTGRQ